MNFKDLVATLADFTRHGLTGSLAGEALQESLHGVLQMQEKLGVPMAHNAKGGIDLARSLANVRQHFMQLYGSMEAIPTPVLQEIQKTFGIRGMRALLIDPTELASMSSQLNNVAGATAKMSGEMLKSPQEQFKVLVANLRQIQIQIGDAILPGMVRLGKAIVPIAQAAAAFAQAHPGWVRMAAIMAAISAVVLVIGGSLALITSALLGFASVVPILTTMGAAFTTISLPVAATVGTIAALGVGIYELIKHWQAVKTFLLELPSLAADVGAAILQALIKPFLDLPENIRNAWGGIKEAVDDMAGKIGRFFIGHSPIPEGPLHDLNLGRELGRSLMPSPVLSALRTTAAAVAIAAPMALAPALPAMASNGGSPVSVNFAPTIHVNGTAGDGKEIGAQVMGYLKDHMPELLNYMNREIERKRRLQY